jgi:hypothetical protein
MAVWGTNQDPGIALDASSCVADCPSSHVKEIGLSLLKKKNDTIFDGRRLGK